MDLKPQLLKLQQVLMPYKQRLLKQWEALSQREQYLLVGLSIFLSVLVFYQLFYVPLDNNINRYKEELISDQELLIFMQTAEPRIHVAKGDFKPLEILTEGMLLPTVENSLAKDGLSKFVGELSLNEDDRVAVQFKEVNFDQLIAWLVEIRVQYGIQVEELTGQPAELPGISNVTLQLTLPPQT